MKCSDALLLVAACGDAEIECALTRCPRVAMATLEMIAWNEANAIRGGEVEWGLWVWDVGRTVHTRWIARSEMRKEEKKMATTHEFAKNRVLGGRLRIIDFWRQPRRTASIGKEKLGRGCLVAGVARDAKSGRGARGLSWPRLVMWLVEYVVVGPSVFLYRDLSRNRG